MASKWQAGNFWHSLKIVKSYAIDQVMTRWQIEKIQKFEDSKIRNELVELIDLESEIWKFEI